MPSPRQLGWDPGLRPGVASYQARAAASLCQTGSWQALAPPQPPRGNRSGFCGFSLCRWPCPGRVPAQVHRQHRLGASAGPPAVREASLAPLVPVSVLGTQTGYSAQLHGTVDSRAPTEVRFAAVRRHARDRASFAAKRSIERALARVTSCGEAGGSASWCAVQCSACVGPCQEPACQVPAGLSGRP